MDQTKERIFGQSTPTHAVIWLHGLGATADDFVPVVPHLGLREDRCIRFVFPQAPQRPITVNQGYVMPGWYDIKGMDLRDKEDLPGMRQSQQTLEGLIDDQISRGISSDRILLAGFSQGGAVAYYTGIRSAHRIAGILALSTYLPFSAQAETEHSRVNMTAPILAMHGTLDPVVPLKVGQYSVEVLQRLGYQVQWQEYVMEHNVIAEQLVDIGAWINQVFDAAA